MENRIIKWLIIILFLFIDLYLLPMSVFYIWPGLKDISIAVLSFAGAIIGGGLTLVGVKYTLDYQALKEFPDKYRGFHEAKSYMELMLNHMRIIGISEDEKKATLESLKEISGNRDVVYKSTSKASFKAYESSIRYMLVVAEWKVKIELMGEKDNISDINSEFYPKLKKAFEEVEAEFVNYKNKYIKLSKKFNM